MNLAINSAMNTAVGAASNVAGNPVPAAAPDALAPPAGAETPAQAPMALPTPALPFGHWIALECALPQTAVAPQEDVVAAPDADAGDAEAMPEEDRAPDILLAAMAPLVAPAALPAMMLAMHVAPPGVVSDAAAAPCDDAAGGPPAVGQIDGARATPTAAAATPLSTAQAAGVPAAAAPGPGTGPAEPNAMPAAAAPVSGEAAAEASADAAPVTAALASGIHAAGTPPAGTRGADSLVLAGPPTAWRQNLHEALGERLQLQIGRNIDQATIRLDPPMLGHIDIAIRHSGGNLEIHIAASNSDVLRQLNTVSDSLRSDLAGRQYSSVSVHVSDVPRMQASAQTGGQTPGQGQADAQGRSRQDQEQARTPGRALHDEAAAGATLFSMN
jgi:flagellar hook-length control protein FliK